MELAENKNIRTLFVTQDDPFYVKLFFEEFFKSFGRLGEIAAVVIVDAMGKKSLKKLARQMYDFYGPADFLKVGLKYASYKVLASAPIHPSSAKHFSLERLCDSYGIQVIRGANINSREFLDRLRTMDLDLIISVAAPVIFKHELISMPKRGCINIHNGMLPKYRGMLPNFWQMYHGEEKVGITVHEINADLDDGRIILQEAVDILPEETLDSLIRRTKRLGAHVMIRAVDMIRTGTVTYRENPTEGSSYFSFPTRENVREFKRSGKKIM